MKKNVKFIVATAVTIVIGTFFVNKVSAQEAPELTPAANVCMEDNQAETGVFCSRVAGLNRYETAAMVEGLEFAPGPFIVFANSNGIDAFFASDEVARANVLGTKAYMLPLPGPGEGPVHPWILNAIRDYTDIHNVFFLGGRKAIADETINEVMAVVRAAAGPGL